MPASVFILSIDLGRRTGFASGRAGNTPPASWSHELGPAGEVGLQCAELARHLEATVEAHGRPDVVCIEKWLNPFAQKSAQAVESSLRLNGAVHAIMGGRYHCNIVEPADSTIRAAVCGMGRAGKRDQSKAMVIQTMKLLKMLPADSFDDNRADAVAGWVWTSTVYAREFRLLPA